MDVYAFQFDGDTLLVRASSERAAVCRAYHEVVTEYDVEPDRLEQLGWPTDDDILAVGDLSDPCILRGD